MIILKLIRKLKIILSSLVGRALLIISGVRSGNNLKITGVPYIYIGDGASIIIGDNASLSGTIETNPLCQNNKNILVAGKGAEIIIGDNCSMSCVIIFSKIRIEIGKNVGLGAGCKIFDTDFHSMDYIARRSSDLDVGKKDPVTIEDDVWVCADATILKGVRIGKGSIIAAGSVVTSDVPPFVLSGGVPAKTIKKLARDQ